MMGRAQDWLPMLAAKYPEDLVNKVVAILAQNGPVQIDCDDLVAESTSSAADAAALLNELVRNHILVVSTTLLCGQCSTPADEDSTGTGRCAICGTSFDDLPQVKKTAYSRPGQRSRDVEWVVTIHGMNTQGKWQQDFSWELSQVYGYSVPVAVYKYGRIFISPLLQFRQWEYRDRLIRELQQLQHKRAQRNRTGPPDVIAHSFGTWLLAQALLKDESLIVGRVILTGSIIGPDFDWKALIDARRVEAVLCHSGGRDTWVRLAQFGIPMAGPSGYRGFNDVVSVEHVHEREFSHSEFLREHNLSRNLRGVWASFLTLPLSQIGTLNLPPPQRERWRPFRVQEAAWLIKTILLVLAATLAALLAIALLIGVHDLICHASSFRFSETADSEG